MKRTLTTVVMAAIAAIVLVAQDPGGPPASAGIDWQPDYAKALTRARKEKRPIMVAFILKGEPANEEICGEHFLDPDIIKTSREFVCILAFSAYGSPDSGAGTENSDRMLATLQGRVSKRQLKAIEHEARTDLLDSNLVSTPQFIFLKPDGKTTLLRHVWTLTKMELGQKMGRALHFSDPTRPAPPGAKEELADVKRLLERCADRNMVKRREALGELTAKDHPDVIAFLIKQTSASMDNQYRLEAIRAMAVKGGAKYLSVLHDVLRKEKSFQMRSTVADTLRQIGLKESAPHIIKLLKSERKYNVRSLLLRALVACAADTEDARKVIKKLLRTGTDLDKVTLCYSLASRKPDPLVDKAALKLMKATKDNVRAAAYLVIGRHKLVGAAKYLKGRLSSEKRLGLKACAWALEQMGQKVSVSTGDPSSDISMLLPSAAY